MIESSAPNCPVPTEQQPVNEYEQLKSSWLFRDCTFSWGSYLTTIAWIGGLSWAIAAPVAAASFPPQKQIGHFILCSLAGASVGIILLLLRLYLGWNYIRERLSSPVVFYEESGWYDGQTWTKPPQLLTRDRLIVTYQIQPIIKRLQISFAGLAGLLVAGTIVWHLV